MMTDTYTTTKRDIESRLALIEEAMTEIEDRMTWMPIWSHDAIEDQLALLADERELLEDKLFDL